MSTTEELPEFLTPSLKLFLSVDLVGSTKLKHDEDVLNGNSNGDGSLEGVGAQWFSILIDFYGGFEQIFLAEWLTTFEDGKLVEQAWKTESAPSLWKINGDELIYVFNVTHPGHIVVALIAWKEALLKYRRRLNDRRSGLDVKATAWMAGFPIGNHEVAFWSDLSKANESSNEPDGKAGQYFRLNRWYEDQKSGAKSDYIKDYIGPSVDTGFRVAQYASPRRFPVSIEIAYFLSNLGLKNEAKKKIGLRYHGRESMKGVLGGSPYPIFWIDCVSPNDKLSAAEDQLKPPDSVMDPHKIASFVDEFFRDPKNKLFMPFIYNCDDPTFRVLPPKYEENLRTIRDVWTQELEKYETELRSSEEDKAPGDTPGADAKDTEIAALQIGSEKAKKPKEPK
nr:hypothetical protein [uncultured Hyphomonas sp.]